MKKKHYLNKKFKGVHMNSQDKSLLFMQIALKYLPEAKEQLDNAGVELPMELIQPFMDLFTKIMQEAYEFGVEDGRTEK
jgi:competence protein ComZ